MAFAKPLSEKEKKYIIEWQYSKTAGAIAAGLNNFPENIQEGIRRTSRGVQGFVLRRRYSPQEPVLSKCDE